jgi:hypothetical protein
VIEGRLGFMVSVTLGLGLALGACTSNDATPADTSSPKDASADRAEAAPLPPLDGALPDDDAAPLDAAKGCPDVFGGYGTIVATGPGCGNIDVAATECLVGASDICTARFFSPADAGAGAVSGLIKVAADGTFTNASLKLGTTAKTGCSGKFTAATSKIDFSCGATTELCTVTMQRTGTTCP